MSNENGFYILLSQAKSAEGGKVTPKLAKYFIFMLLTINGFQDLTSTLCV